LEDPLPQLFINRWVASKLIVVEMREEVRWFIEHRIKRTCESLERNGFKAVYVGTREEALKEALRMIPEGARVGVGGSVTVREVGLVDELRRRGNEVFETWRRLTPEEDLEIRRKHLTCDVFVSSSNAVTEDGKLVNIDGTGNRVAAMIFGPPKVVIIAGVNKIVRDVEEGIRRIREVATPMNVKRMGGSTPCTQRVCDLERCEPPNRHCHVITIMEKRPTKTDISVILVGEPLGF